MGTIQGPDPTSHFCGAALVKPAWMVTAAHCLTKLDPSMVRIRIGSEDRTSGGTLSTVDKFVPHPTEDMALVHLTQQLTNNPFTIPNFQIKTDVPVELVGWGVTQPGGTTYSIPAQRMDTRTTAPTNCADLRSTNELCTDNPKNAGPCTGDDGGPALTPAIGQTWYLTGIISRYNTNCGTAPAILVNVPALHAWIDQNSTP
ncbi:serine protease [Kibdelosporangium lantanae]